MEIITLVSPPIIKISDHDEEASLKAREVRHSAVIDKYFTYRLAGDDVSQSDLDVARAT